MILYLFISILFNTFINDLILACDETSESDCPRLGDTRIGCLVYAGDFILVSKTKKGLQNLLNALQKKY